MNKVLDFFKRHLILTNLLIMALVTVVLIWCANIFMASWTGHGETQIVPDVHNRSLAEAKQTLQGSGFAVEIADSVYNDGANPGYVVEQIPSPGSVVKPGRPVYLTINAVNPPQVQIPALVGISLRQARATLNSLGFPDVTEERVPSDYKDLVIAVRSMGVTLRPGTKLPVGTPIVLQVGEGYVEPEPAPDDYTEFSASEWEIEPESPLYD